MESVCTIRVKDAIGHEYRTSRVTGSCAERTVTTGAFRFVFRVNSQTFEGSRNRYVNRAPSPRS
eukprot:857865-Pyramimonas_sp.AAC.4